MTYFIACGVQPLQKVVRDESNTQSALRTWANEYLLFGESLLLACKRQLAAAPYYRTFSLGVVADSPL